MNPIVLFHVGAFLNAILAYGQTPLSTPKELLLTDPAAFAQWLEIGRPAPISGPKAGVSRRYPSDGEINDIDGAARRKLAALGELL